MKLQKAFAQSTIRSNALYDPYFSGRHPEGWLMRVHDDSGWTLSGFISDGCVEQFTAVCEDGVVLRTFDGELYSSSEAIFDEFLEQFPLINQ